MLFQRYANPMPLLDQMIKAGRLTEFIGEIISIHNEEQEEKAMWEFWLHKDFERTFSEFCAAMQGGSTTEPKTASKKELTEIVKQSMEIASFVPQEE